MDSVLYASMDVCECNIPCVCKNASMSVNPYNCDDMLLESIGVFCENDELIAKLNESNKLVEKYKNLAEISFEKLKEF